jgi:hypothetical protein
MSLLDHPILTPTTESARSLKRAAALTATIVLVVLAILLPVVQSSDEAAQGYRIRALQKQKADLQAQIYMTQSQIAQLGALSRVDSEARSRLAMAPVTREVSLSVAIPAPDVRPLPNNYVPQVQASATAEHDSFWQRLLHLLPFS